MTHPIGEQSVMVSYYYKTNLVKLGGLEQQPFTIFYVLWVVCGSRLDQVYSIYMSLYSRSWLGSLDILGLAGCMYVGLGWPRLGQLGSPPCGPSLASSQFPKRGQKCAQAPWCTHGKDTFHCILLIKASLKASLLSRMGKQTLLLAVWGCRATL